MIPPTPEPPVSESFFLFISEMSSLTSSQSILVLAAFMHRMRSFLLSSSKTPTHCCRSRSSFVKLFPMHFSLSQIRMYFLPWTRLRESARQRQARGHFNRPSPQRACAIVACLRLRSAGCCLPARSQLMQRMQHVQSRSHHRVGAVLLRKAVRSVSFRFAHLSCLTCVSKHLWNCKCRT